uniref:protein GFS12 n=1 Tax=Erigeron canadensis TaxID=72917 RepID=UPI001CB8B646|nr:protein GFS12 [Erigeron canadensis]
MEDEFCLECLERQIRTDFTDKLIYNYAISAASPLPFASNAVVQVSSSEKEGLQPHFILMYLRINNQQHNCFINYINEHLPEDIKPTPLDNESNESQLLSNEGGSSCLPGLGCNNSTCDFSARYSCLRTLTALAPISQIGSVSLPAFEDLVSSFLSGSIEDHVLHSLTLLLQGKATGRDNINFLNLIGVPSFTETSFPGCIRHPNIVPIMSMMKSPTHINIIIPKTPYTLENILHYSPDALKSNWHIKFLMYQILSPLRYMHGLGISHGSICPSNVLLSGSFWCWLHIGDTLKSNSNVSKKIGCYTEGCHSSELFADMKISNLTDWHTVFIRWWSGELTNFEYLLFLNKLAGRRWGDYTFHTVMPWVIDFSVKPDENNELGWRNLSKTKWRLAKGDEQLDFTYLTSEIPHHVSDECLSELAVCSYKARRLPLSVLRTAVRSVYEPNEYPSTMYRLYQWTPDECIPEFYYDPQIFRSIHSGMSDLAVPSWAGSPEEFIRLHRDALESDRVSCQIHDWIDIIFGYKMSGEAAISAKNVMLPPSEPTSAKSVGRRQLFSLPHPPRWGVIKKKGHGKEDLLHEISNLQALEEATTFIEHASHLSPLYRHDLVKDSSGLEEVVSDTFEYVKDLRSPSIVDINFLLQTIETDDNSTSGYQDFLLWRQKASHLTNMSVNIANDVFSIGCILAELHLRKPLFNPTSLAHYLDSGGLPKLMHELPPQVNIIVEACIQKEWDRRPSIKSLLESPYFPATVKSSYLFLSPLQLLSNDESKLHYVASYAKCGALKLMGSFAAEMCAPHCLPLLLTPLSDTVAEWAYIMLKEFLKCLNLQALKTLILPVIQKILQTTGYSHMKVSLLQDSFVRELWSKIGKQLYLENIHSMVLLNLYVSPHKSSSGAASVLLIGSSDELGVPVTVYQTILPLIQCFGKGLCSDGIDVIVRIGGLFGEVFIVEQILPLLKNVVRACIDVSNVIRPEPMQSWSSLALMDCLMTLDGILELLPSQVVVKELIEDGGCLYIQILMTANLGIPSLQVAATSLVTISQQIGPELTSLYVMPKLKGLFEKLAFSEETHNGPGSAILNANKNKVVYEQMETRMDLVLLLYPPFASLLGIEALRKCCSTWLILEKYLLWHHNWKWEYTEEPSRSAVDNINVRRASYSKNSTSEHNPAKVLLHGVGWSVPQSQVDNVSKKSLPHKRLNRHNINSDSKHMAPSTPREQEPPWHWFPSPATSWDGPDFLGRIGASSNEIPWKISASVIHSVRAHHGALRSFGVCQDECTFYTAGVGQGFKGSVRKWDLSRIACSSGYDGHEEVVNDICGLGSSERTASCDGTIHVWHSHSGKNISVIAENSGNSTQYGSSSTSLSRIHSDQANMLDYSSLGSGILSSAYDGSLYTCMHHLETVNRLVAGTGNGSLRFIDIDECQKLHLWKSDSSESSFPSLISSICSCGSTKTQTNGAVTPPSWIAAGLSSGQCRLLDMRSGNLITSWQAHDGYVTKLAAPEDHLLVSSSLDKTLRVWDLRKNLASPLILFRGHTDGVSGFSVWGQDVISISRSKIGLSSLTQQDGQQRITPQHLYMADRESRNMSVLSNIAILPFSRLFLVGTEDGYLKVCC